MLANITPVAAQLSIWIAFGVVALIAIGLFARWLIDCPRETVDAGLIWRAVRIYSHFFHHLRVEGKQWLPRERYPGPLVVVMNHTAGVDPVLVQAVCPFYVRYVMAEDMRLPTFEWLWNWSQAIFVDRVKRSAHGTREALRHLKEGGVLGIFPEGGLERPACHILPFEAGVGMIVKRTGAKVLPIVIDGTPAVDPAWASLWTSSHARLRIKEPIDYRGSGLSATQITEDLRARFAEWTGWPLIDEEQARELVEKSTINERSGRSTNSLPAA